MYLILFEKIEEIMKQSDDLKKEKQNQDEQINTINYQLEMKEKVLHEKEKVHFSSRFQKIILHFLENTIL